MVSRRKFITFTAAGAAALSTPIWSDTFTRRAGATTAPTCTLALVNGSGNDTVYVYLTGQDPEYTPTGLPHPGFVKASGEWYHLPFVSADHTPLEIDPAIQLTASAESATHVTIPHMIGARIWFSLGSKLVFKINPPNPETPQEPRPGLEQPNPQSKYPEDENLTKDYTFCEFTFNDAELYANITYVDLVAAPISFVLEGNATQTVPGLPNGALQKIGNGLIAQHGQDERPWDQLVTTDKTTGRVMRVSAPHLDGFDFSDYYDSYVEEVWRHYATNELTVNLDGRSYSGTVRDDVLTFPGLNGDPFRRPNAREIFKCDAGPFVNMGGDDRSAVAARLAAAFNRGTLLLPGGEMQPDGVLADRYYPTGTTTNHYSRLVHEHATVGYAFPYDDVGPAGHAPVDGHAADPEPRTFTVTVGQG